VGIYFLQVDAIGQVPAQNQRQEVTAATPFPALPLDLTWRISSRWAATVRGAYLKATLSGFRGWYADSHEDIQYRWNPTSPSAWATRPSAPRSPAEAAAFRARSP